MFHFESVGWTIIYKRDWLKYIHKIKNISHNITKKCNYMVQQKRINSTYGHKQSRKTCGY